MLAGCDHGTPFVPGNYAPNEPFNAPPLIRLTLNPAEDMMPTWLPGGDILFTAQRPDRADHDWCFAAMPGSAGAISRYVCRTPASNDSLDAFTEGATTSLGGGQIAYVREDSYRLPIPPASPAVNAVVVAPLADPNASHVVRAFPYVAPSGRTHWGLSHLRWLDASRLIYVGQDVRYQRACSSCSLDTLRTGLEVTILDLAQSTSAVSVVSGTDNASSVSVGATSDTIYFTRDGEAVVYRQILSSGVTDTVHDFGAGRLVRDVAWAAGQLFVVVDGTFDQGGEVHILGPGPGVDSVVQAPFSTGGASGFVWFQRAAPSPDGRRFVAQGFAFTVVIVAGVADTTIATGRELWLYELP